MRVQVMHSFGNNLILGSVCLCTADYLQTPVRAHNLSDA